MELFVLPVVNGVLPAAEGGEVQGVFLDLFTAQTIYQLGVGGQVLLCPALSGGEIYPIGVIGQVEEFWDHLLVNQQGQEIKGFFVRISGRGRGRAKGLRQQGRFIIGEKIENINFRKMREDNHPVICGAGWQPMGGYTELLGSSEPVVTIYGRTIGEGRDVHIAANLRGLVSYEQAHTIEHGIIRCLEAYGLCTPKTLISSLQKEIDQLKSSIHMGLQYKMPEMFGQTDTGSCGNPMSRLAQFYLAQEFVNQIEKGEPVWQSLERARQKTLSRVFDDLDVSLEDGKGVVQGLKKGMFHDDSQLSPKIIKMVVNRFPISPWI